MSGTQRTATMTNNTTPSPNVASASTEGSGTEAYHAFNKDAVSGTWQVSSGTSGYLQFDFGSALWAIDEYRLTDNGFPTRMPGDWVFAGSQNGTDFTTLDTQSSQSFSSSETKTYTFTNAVQYRYYRITISNTGGGNPLQIPEMGLYGPDSNSGSSFLFNFV